jgi:hypothetical protein
MVQRQSCHGAHHPCLKLPLALAARRRVVRVEGQPALPDPGVLLLDIGHAHAVDQPEGLLPQRHVAHAGQTQALGRRRGRLHGARQIAAVQPLHRLERQPLAETTRLLMPGGVEWHVDLALKPQFPVPVGLAVANE